jgi:hypothetical protein
MKKTLIPAVFFQKRLKGIKPVATPRGVEMTTTNVVTQELLDCDDVLALTPAIYQECIPGTRQQQRGPPR